MCIFIKFNFKLFDTVRPGFIQPIGRRRGSGLRHLSVLNWQMPVRQDQVAEFVTSPLLKTRLCDLKLRSKIHHPAPARKSEESDGYMRNLTHPTRRRFVARRHLGKHRGAMPEISRRPSDLSRCIPLRPTLHFRQGVAVRRFLMGHNDPVNNVVLRAKSPVRSGGKNVE